jgi:isopentenyl-diphosphate Delta-isomerase
MAFGIRGYSQDFHPCLMVAYASDRNAVRFLKDLAVVTVERILGTATRRRAASAAMAQRLDMLIDRVDPSDQVVGTITRRDVFQQQANFRVAHVFVFNAKGELLLQHIAPGLRHEGEWGSSTAGYLQHGEAYEDAALRKLREELGITVALVDVGKTSMLDQSSTKFINLFAASYNGPFVPNPLDVDRLEFASIAQILSERQAGARAFTETFLYLLDFYLSTSTKP